MARRIEIELTSARPDGSWTWRAAGAREPKGVLDGALVPEGIKAGTVMRAEANFEIDGITIVGVTPPKVEDRRPPDRIEIIGPSSGDTPGVTTQLVSRSDRRPGDRRRDREDGRPRRERDESRPGRDDSRGRGPRSGRPDAAAAPREGSGEDARRRGPERGRRDAGSSPEHPRREGGGVERRRPPREAAGDRAERRRPDGEGRPDRRRAPAGAEAAAAKPRRFNPGHTHRQAVMATLAPEEQPIAEQVLRGGIPAVRTALHLEREAAVAQGRPAPNTDQLIAMAEALLPRLKAAEWRDRAEAAAKEPDAIALRDLRAVVAGSDVARDEDARALAHELRQALDRRVSAMRDQWAHEVAQHLEERRVVRALRLSGRPPEPAARLEQPLLEQLAHAASEAMAAETPPDRWVALIEAVASSPVRRDVKPAGFPPEPGAELRKLAHQQSGRIPALAAMLGIAIPPPPMPTRPRRQERPPRRPGPERPAPSAEAPGTERPAPSAEAPGTEQPAPEQAHQPQPEPEPEQPALGTEQPAPELPAPAAEAGEQPPHPPAASPEGAASAGESPSPSG